MQCAARLSLPSTPGPAWRARVPASRRALWSAAILESASFERLALRAMSLASLLAAPSVRSLAVAPARAAATRMLHAICAGSLALLLLAGQAGAAAEDRINVRQANLALLDTGEPGVVLDAEFDFELPWVLVDAVNRGVALYFVVEFELYRERWYWFDRRVAAQSLTYRLTYSPLTRQYRLARGTLALPYDTLDDALASLRRIRGWKVLERGMLRPDEDYRAQLRMRLDTSQLPKPFQINALTNRDWTLASDWRSVSVTAELTR